jgi:hypothetical protein
MSESKKETINVKDTDLTIIRVNDEDYICITDFARYKNAEHTDDVIKNWMRNRNTIELLNYWVFGSLCIIRILNPSNSTGLE